MDAEQEEEAWATIDRINQSWAESPDGTVAIELWRTGSGFGYTLLPLHGDWRALLTEPGRVDEWVEGLSKFGIAFSRFRVNVKEQGSWTSKALWSVESGVKWLN